MPTTDTNLADRTGSLVESHKGYDPRITFFYFAIGAALIFVAVGLGYQQLSKTDEYNEAERQQNQRRVIFPGPRGDIRDRNGTLIVGNTHRFAVVLQLDELKRELRTEQYTIYKNYLAAGEKKDVPSDRQLKQIARVTLVQRYLDEVNRVLGRNEKVNVNTISRHFEQRLLLPFRLLEGLTDAEAARLLERIPVRSPLQVYAEPVRTYPYGSAAAHTIGYVRPDADVVAKGFPGEDLTTFRVPGASGQNGLEKWFDDQLQGEAGGRIYRVDPAGYRINPPLAERAPKQGRELVTSLDIDLQVAAEETIGDQRGAAVAIEIATGEVLVLASKPDYDLNKFSPRATNEYVADMTARGAWVNLAVNGFYPPGSTFKILTSIAGLRAGVLTPDDPIVNCAGRIMVGNRSYPCDVGHGIHGNVLLREAIAKSCDIYYYKAGEFMTPKVLADEGRRFRMDQLTGIELPNQQNYLVMPDPDWKRRERNAAWVPGDTANMSIGQGDVLVSPLHMACFMASVARGETYTKPTLLHVKGRPPQRTEPIGLTPAQHTAIIEGMAGTVTRGTAQNLATEALRVPGITIGAKTGTAQKRVAKDGKVGNINLAWIICFAPVEKPEVAIAVMIEGENIGEDFYGGQNAGPVASAILKKYYEKKRNPARTLIRQVTAD